jgi:hypothetical protein
MPFDSSEYEYADIKVSVLGANLSGLRGIKYKKKQDKSLVYGQGNQPKSIQRGNKSYEGTLSILKSDYDLLDAAAVVAGYEDITDVPSKYISLTVVYQKPGATMLSTDTLLSAEFHEAEDGMKQGEQFKEIELPFLFLRKKKL